MKNEEYIQYAQELSGEYKDYYLQLNSLVKEYQLTEEENENAMSELVDMLLCAQEDSRKCNKIFGDNLDIFTKNYINSLFPFQKITLAFGSVMGFVGTIMVVGFFYLLYQRITGEVTGSLHNFFQEKINLVLLVGVVFGIFAAEVNAYWSKKLRGQRRLVISEQKSLLVKLRPYLVVAVFVLIGVLLMALLSEMRIVWMVDFTELIAYGLVIELLGFLGIVFTKIFEKDGTDTEKIVLSAMEREYQKKREKKGWTLEFYLQKKKKFYKIWMPLLAMELLVFFGLIDFLAISSIFSNGINAWGVLGVMIILGLNLFFLSAIFAAGRRGEKFVQKALSGVVIFRENR